VFSQTLPPSRLSEICDTERGIMGREFIKKPVSLSFAVKSVVLKLGSGKLIN
jgi:hypothetical protein